MLQLIILYIYSKNGMVNNVTGTVYIFQKVEDIVNQK